MTVTISTADAEAALRQHLQALALPGWEQLRLQQLAAGSRGESGRVDDRREFRGIAF